MQLEITTYRELEQWALHWIKGRLPLVVITSRGGLGKSMAAESVLHGERHLLIKGHVTPLRLYIQLYDWINEPVVFDDVDQLLVNKVNVATLKAVCDSTPIRKVSYESTSKILGSRPNQFETGSPVLVLTNKFRQLDENLQALATRAISLVFNPTQQEILQRCRAFAKRRAILDWLEQEDRVQMFPDFSLREFHHLEKLAEAGIDWKDTLLRSCDPRLAEVWKLQGEFDNEPDRVVAYAARGFGSRDDYYIRKRRLGIVIKRVGKRRRGNSPFACKEASNATRTEGAVG
jgi:hypothetical protein